MECNAQIDRTTNISSLTVDGSSVTDSVGIANSMNEFFCNVGSELCKDIPDTENGLLKGEYAINPTNATFSLSPVVSKQVSLAMNKLKTSNGFGLDEISSFFLKTGMSILAEPLSQLFNLSFSAGIFPDQWKIARISLPIIIHYLCLSRGSFIGILTSCRLTRTQRPSSPNHH